MSFNPSQGAAAADALLELVNIGVGRAASGLSDLSGREIEITMPRLEFLHGGEPGHFDDLEEAITLRVSQGFSGGLNGCALMVLNRGGAVRLAQLLLGKNNDDDAFDDNEQGALLELGNIVMGNIVAVLADQTDSPVHYQMPQIQLRGIATYLDLISDLAAPSHSMVLIMRAALTIKEDKISGYLMLVFNESDFAAMFDKLERLASS